MPVATLKLQASVLPQESVAVQFTVVMPDGKNAPDGGTQAIATGAGQLSVAVTVKFTTPPVASPQERIGSTGQ